MPFSNNSYYGIDPFEAVLKRKVDVYYVPSRGLKPSVSVKAGSGLLVCLLPVIYLFTQKQTLDLQSHPKSAASYKVKEYTAMTVWGPSGLWLWGTCPFLCLRVYYR